MDFWIDIIFAIFTSGETFLFGSNFDSASLLFALLRIFPRLQFLSYKGDHVASSQNIGMLQL